MDTWVTFAAPAETIAGYSALPATPPPWPALIVIHPIAGVTPQIREIARSYAAEGYLALAPNLYTNDPEAPRHDFDVINEAAHMSNHGDWEAYLASVPGPHREQLVAARKWMSARPKGGHLDAVHAAFRYLAGRADVTCVGSIGYCQGGTLTGALAALGVDLAAGVIYYGGSPKGDDVAKIRCPLEGHYGVTDRRITGGVYEFALAMKAAGRHFAYSVYDAGHGFIDAPPSLAYNAEASRQARDRAGAFLAQHLLGRG